MDLKPIAPCKNYQFVSNKLKTNLIESILTFGPLFTIFLVYSKLSVPLAELHVSLIDCKIIFRAGHSPQFLRHSDTVLRFKKLVANPARIILTMSIYPAKRWVRYLHIVVPGLVLPWEWGGRPPPGAPWSETSTPPAATCSQVCRSCSSFYHSKMYRAHNCVKSQHNLGYAFLCLLSINKWW